MSELDDLLGEFSDEDLAAMEEAEDLIEPPKRRVKEDLGPMQDLMLRCCPPDEDNYVSIAILAKHLDITTQALFAMIRKGRITYKRAKQIVDLCPEGTVKVHEFEDYLV